MIALLEAHRAGLLGRRHWIPNLISGVVVGIVALPLAMAFAIASGAKPEQGLYTAIVAGLVVSLFGGSRLQIAGPTGAFVVILAGVTAKYGIVGLQIATLMAGAILLLLGLARMGGIIKYIPSPVIVGFTAGIGVIIFVGQWKDFFGLPAVSGTHFHEKFWHLLEVLPQLHGPTTLLALLALLLVLWSSRIPGLRKVPGPLVALLVASVLQLCFQFDGVATIGSAFGGIPRGLPELHWPELSMGKVIELIGPAFTIAMLGAIESLLSAVVADGMAGTRHDANQELIGQGLANMLTPILGGFAATGAIARTATNVRNGATSPLSGVVHAFTLIAIVLFLAPLAVHVPLAALAAILFVIAWNMSEVPRVLRMLRSAPRADVVILLVTFGLTVLVDLVVAVNIGVILATLHFLRRMASSVDVHQDQAEEIRADLARSGLPELPPGVLVYSVEGPFFFGAVDNFQRALVHTGTDPEVLVIRLRWVPFIDFTALQTLEHTIEDLKQRKVRVLLTGANPKVRRKLRKAGILQLLGEGNEFDSLSDALASLKAEQSAAAPQLVPP